MPNKIVRYNLRLNLKKEEHAKVWEILQNLDKSKYKSYTHLMVLALTDYMKRQSDWLNDPYLETRERENAFIQRIVEGVRDELRFSLPTISALPVANQSEGNNSKREKTIEEGLVDWDFIGNS